VDFFIVNFKIAAAHQELHALVLLINEAEDMGKAVRDDSSEVIIAWNTEHRMSFTAACLSIGEDCSIIALDDGLDEGEGTLVIDSLLLGVSIVDGVERKIF